MDCLTGSNAREKIDPSVLQPKEFIGFKACLLSKVERPKVPITFTRAFKTLSGFMEQQRPDSIILDEELEKALDYHIVKDNHMRKSGVPILCFNL